MSGITPISSKPATAAPAAAAPAVNAPASAAAPATTAAPAAGDGVKVGGGQSASGGLEVYQSNEVSKDIRPVLPPAPEPVKDPVELKPYVSQGETVKTHNDVQQLKTAPKQPIKNTHFSIIEGPASPDP